MRVIEARVRDAQNRGRLVELDEALGTAEADETAKPERDIADWRPAGQPRFARRDTPRGVGRQY